jgi:hypothetical protein
LVLIANEGETARLACLLIPDQMDINNLPIPAITVKIIRFKAKMKEFK